MVALVGSRASARAGWRSRSAVVRRPRVRASLDASRSSPSAFPYHLVGQLVPQLFRRRRTATRKRPAPCGAEADDRHRDLGRVLDDVLGETAG